MPLAFAKVRVAPVPKHHTTEAYRVSGGKDPHIFDLGTNEVRLWGETQIPIG